MLKRDRSAKVDTTAGNAQKGKKNPAIMAGKTGMVSMARKTGILCYWLLLVLLTACSDEADCKFESLRSSASRRS